MESYEIRVMRNGDNITDIYSSSHISDHAAVRRAETLAGEGDCIEVWRGANCIYCGMPETKIGLPMSKSAPQKSDDRLDRWT